MAARPKSRRWSTVINDIVLTTTAPDEETARIRLADIYRIAHPSQDPLPPDFPITEKAS